MPRRRTFACALRAFAHSEASALRHPACAGRLRRLSGHGQPLADFHGEPAHVRDDVPGAQHPRKPEVFLPGKSPRRTFTMASQLCSRGTGSPSRIFMVSRRTSWMTCRVRSTRENRRFSCLVKVHDGLLPWPANSAPGARAAPRGFHGEPYQHPAIGWLATLLPASRGKKKRPGSCEPGRPRSQSFSSGSGGRPPEGTVHRRSHLPAPQEGSAAQVGSQGTSR